MKKGLKLAIATAVILSLFASSGCFDIVELDTISIVTGVGIDKDAKTGLVRLTVQAGKADAVGSGGEEGGGPSEKAYQILDSMDSDVVGALDKLCQDNSRTLFLHHNQFLIFGQTRAKDGIADDLDAFMRYQQSHMSVYVLVSEGDPREVLEVKMGLEKIPSIGISRMIKNKTEISKVFGINLLELVAKLVSEPSAAAVPIIKIVKEKDEARPSLSGMAIFKDGKMIGQLSENQARGYAWILGEIKSGSIKINTDKGSAELSIKSSESKIKASFDKNGMPKIKVDITGNFIVEQLTGFEGQQLEKVIELVNKSAANTLKKEMLSCFKETQRLNADILGFGSYIYKHHNRKWKPIKDKWDKIYPSLESEFNIKANIEDAGKISISPKMSGGGLS